MSNGNGNGVWKYVATVAVSVLVGMGIQVFREPKDPVTKQEVAMQNLILSNKIDTLSNEVAALRTTVNQQNTDLAGIAEKVGVTAHPVVAPTR